MTIVDSQTRLGLINVDAIIASITIDLQLGVAVSTGTTGADIVGGSTNNDVIETLLGDDFIIGSDGIDTIDGSFGTDILVFDFASARHDSQGVGRDLIITDLLVRTDEGILPINADVQSTIIGIDGLVFRFGEDVAGTVVDDQDDTGSASLFLGGEGVQFISGGGTDTFTGSGAGDVFSFLLGAGTGTDGTASGGQGTDAGIVRLAAGVAQTVTFSEAGGTITVSNNLGEQAQFTGVEEFAFGIDGLVPGGSGATATVDASSATRQILADFTDGGAVTDYDANFVVTTGSGDDIIQTNAGDDILDGGTGSNQLAGGLGDDTYYINSAGDQVFEEVNGGHDSAYFTYDFRANAADFGNVEKFYLIGTADEGRTNSRANELYANPTLGSLLLAFGGDDLLVGGTGDDVLVGGTGNDTMRGGQGDDWYFVTEAGDVVIELADEGIDEIRTNLNTTLGEHFENLRLKGAASIGTGNAADNSIFAGSAAATLSGLAGDDILYGSASADTLDGGTENDILYGNGGADTLFGGTGDDRLNGGLQGDTLWGGDDNDRLNGNEGLDFLYGEAGADRLDGGEDPDQLFGGTGNDVLLGGAGNDILDGGEDNDRLTGGEGRDRMTGGTGQDDFLFGEGDFAGLAASDSDRILDFSDADGDLIILSAVDAIVGGDDDAFAFIGAAAFSNTAGELRYEAAVDHVLVQGDTNGDGVADFAIRVDDVAMLVESNFVL